MTTPHVPQKRRSLFTRFVRWIGYDLGISPNQITLGRLLVFIPGWLMWVYKDELAAASALPWQLYGTVAMVVVTVVIVFDIVDGALARETGQVSSQGKVLDPITDKFITYSCLALFWNAIDHTGFLLLLVLDIASTCLRGVQVQGANQYGKLKAFSQNISKIFFALAVLVKMPSLNLAGNYLIWQAVVLASISVGIRVLPARVKTAIKVMIPQMVTLCNLGGGLAAIFFALEGQAGLAAVCNFAAMFFDLIDGAVARKLGVSSRFGSYFDTIADMISFGVAPAVQVVCVSGVRPLSVGLGIGYFLATMIRLYDYGKSKDRTPPGFFRGLPSPAGAWLVVAAAQVPVPWVGLVVMVLSGALMCAFPINWIHFNRAFSNMSRYEVGASIGIGLVLALLTGIPGLGIAGPIVVYVLSPQWRKP